MAQRTVIQCIVIQNDYTFMHKIMYTVYTNWQFMVVMYNSKKCLLNVCSQMLKKFMVNFTKSGVPAGKGL